MNNQIIRQIAVTAALLSIALISVTSQTVTPWFTSGDKTRLLQQQTPVSFGTSSNPANVTITLDPATTYQTMDGFGYTLTEGSAEVISSLDATQQALLLNELFNKSTGLGVSVLRISIGASDLSPSNYSYNETAGDIAMANFSLSGPDLNYLVPILKKVLLINPDIKILATPWTAPRWMKTTGDWVGGSLKTNYYAAYATYFVTYLDAMKAQGIPIWAVTPQNEPENGSAEPSMLMTSMEEKNFINNNLGPAMANAGYSGAKIIAFDHNCNNTAYPVDVLNNSLYVDGAAFHLYAGDISALTTVKNATGKNVYFTEQYTASTGSFSGDLAWHMQNVLIGAGNNWAKTILEWNLANNASMDPHTPGGCSTCQGAVTITNSSSYTRNLSFYLIGHLSKFVVAGAVRIKSTSSGSNIQVSAYENPDRSVAVLAYNSNSGSQTVKISWNSLAMVCTVPASTAATFVWKPTPNAISDVPLNQIQLSPNPGHDIITLKVPGDETNYTTIRFSTLNGKMVLNQSIAATNGVTIVNVSNLANGIYLIRIDGLSDHLYGRFIKQ
ncbi:MAG: glycoside hydrolase family 30 beta sandwich domain-containing protein [Paludibacter sp.]|nr:glycoside hydrolase family 30 beta sandwich domain-containing protein [Paludibacter sp.]